MTTALSDDSKLNLSFKKVLGKAQTSNTKEISNEAIGYNISIGASTIFGYTPPTPVSSAYYAIIGGIAEKVPLKAEPMAGTKDANGRFQAFQLSLPADYQTRSSNPNKGSGVFVNGQVLNATTGTLQVIHPSFGANYTALTYHTASGATQIPALDARDWVLDYYNGIFFQQDPPTDTDENPAYIDAFIYINDYVLTRLTGSGGTPGGATTQIQFNNASSFGGSANLTFNGTTLTGSYTGSVAEVTTLSSSALLTQGNSHLSGGVVHKRTAVVTSYTASVTDYILGVTGVPTSILFDATKFEIGQVVVIKDESGNATSTTGITLVPSGSQKIDGETSQLIESKYGAVLLYSNGSHWFVY